MMAEEAIEQSEMEQALSEEKEMEESAAGLGVEAFSSAIKVFSVGRKLMLASLGAVAITAEEAGGFLGRLIERGELAEMDAAKLVNITPEEGDKLEPGGLSNDKGPETLLEESVEAILARLNVPTRRDIEELTRKVDELNRKIAMLG
jgi:polyhydroxyalkanoate synthesis regulator phasin